MQMYNRLKVNWSMEKSYPYANSISLPFLEKRLKSWQLLPLLPPSRPDCLFSIGHLTWYLKTTRQVQRGASHLMQIEPLWTFLRGHISHVPHTCTPQTFTSAFTLIRGAFPRHSFWALYADIVLYLNSETVSHVMTAVAVTTEIHSAPNKIPKLESPTSVTRHGRHLPAMTSRADG